MGTGKWLAIGAAVAAIGGAVAYAQYRDIEQPPYLSLETEGEFELRQYAPMIVAEVTHTGERRRALNAGFRRLAAYIFAEDRPGEEIAMTSPVMQDQSQEIAMTSPVLQDGSNETGSWRTRFVMPSEYSMESLPTPPSDITLTKVPGRKLAAVRFSGRGSGKDLAEQEKALREWIGQQNLEVAGPAEFAFYDAPMVPPPLRRNEVLIPVK